jgi:hypothetical protein
MIAVAAIAAAVIAVAAAAVIANQEILFVVVEL